MSNSKSENVSSSTSGSRQHAVSWQLKTQTLRFDSGSVLMGIINVTPDSFSDGGSFSSTDQAVQHALQLMDDGASILDIGGESTRPYSTPVSETEELNRVIPVIERLVQETVVQETKTPISIDTSKSKVALEAIAAGAEIVNDVTGLEGDPEMLSVVAESKVGICAMHMQGTPQTMQDNPVYSNIVEEIYEYLASRKSQLLSAGLEEESICLDPGIGFGKTHEHNIQLMRGIDRFHDLNVPILVGHSRKGFIGKLSADDSTDRTAGTIAATLHLWRSRIQIIRVHDVLAMNQAISVAQAIE